MTPQDVVHDSLADSFLGLEFEPSRSVLEAASESVVENLAAAFPYSDPAGVLGGELHSAIKEQRDRIDVLEDALRRIAHAYQGDRDYPGQIARAALGARV